MKRTFLLIGILVILLAVVIEARKKNVRQFWGSSRTETNNADDGIDIDTELSGDGKILLNEDDEDGDDDEDVYESSGEEGIDYDDEGDDDIEESGSGDVEVPVTEDKIVPVTDSTVNTKVLQPCEQLRDSSTYAKYKPKCTADGQFEVLQCHPDTRECWCVDKTGKTIPGTLLQHPTVPDCLFGGNLTTCVFQLVQATQGMLGVYRPSCTPSGDYESIQCHGSECWCVDKLGNEIDGTITNKPTMPTCPDKMKPFLPPTPETKESTPAYTTLDEGGGGIVVDNEDNTIDVGETPVDKVITTGEDEVEKGDDEGMKEINEEGEYNRAQKMDHSLLVASPGLLAAIIGGAVVGLLCMILLVMFIVYRMRKKDEGSYPLDEQKYQNYSYSKAPDKEFYA